MQADNWKTIKDTLLEALKLDPAKRRDYLEHAGLSAEVRAEVESLLIHEDSAQDFMSVTASGFTREFFDGSGPAANALINQKIGIYEIVSELGFGGMGVVYLARRSDGKFEQKVAIKMLKREFNTEKIRQTFQREKEILATLSHPNIATLLDAGTSDDGIPYLVMEYIEGEPIDKFCQGRKLSLNHRLKLFNKVCDTVSLAHRSLIVHRDLKPSNILVTKDGEPKLLDFGISKLLDAEAEDAGAVTHLGAMTPLYASPEQIKGEPVTTSTDVYSLGVVLFKILTGNLPYTLAKTSNGNLLKELTEAAPTLPSEAAKSEPPASAGGSQPQPHPPADAGGSDKSSISPSELRGDLDNIVLKALRKEPPRRYQTVEQFSADIWRFVDGMPVLARPATLRYRASKFYGRNKVAVMAAILIVASLFLGIAVALSQAKTAREQARIAEQERDTARRASERAERTSRFMQSFLDYAIPHWYGRGKGRMDVTVREAIDDAAGRIDTELAEELEVRADLHYTIGQVYATHDEEELYLSHMRQSYELYRRALGEQHPKVARAIYYLSMAMHGNGSDLKEVSAFLRDGIAMMRQTDPDNINLPYMLQQLAHFNMYVYKQNPNESLMPEAENLILEAKILFIRHYGENHGSTVSADGSLAKLALTRGDLNLAENLFAENARRYQQASNERYGYLWAVCYLAKVKLALGKVDEAEALFEQALEQGRREWGVKDPRFENLEKEIKQARAR
jgi:serine/threonine protein kinase